MLTHLCTYKVKVQKTDFNDTYLSLRTMVGGYGSDWLMLVKEMILLEYWSWN